MDKKGLSTNMLKTVIVGIVLVTVLITVLADMLPTAMAAGDTLNATDDVPFGSFWASGGIVWTILIVGIFLAVLGFFLGKKFFK